MKKSANISIFKITLFILILTFLNIQQSGSTPPAINADDYKFEEQNNLGAEIESVLQHISIDSITNFISHLQSYETRFMIAPNRFEISEWLYEQFIQMGFSNVQYDSFSAQSYFNTEGLSIDTTTIQRNVIATIEGSVNPNQQIIICGHYDSFNSNGNPFISAPGADDNASGTTAVLEIARAVKKSGLIPDRTLKFIAFAAEELMNFGDGGSDLYSEMAFNNSDDIILVINHDMISHTLQSLENSTIFINRHPNSDIYSSLAIDCINQYSNIMAATTNFAGADLRGFTSFGYNGIYFEESEFSPYYHSANDIQDNYSMEFCTEVIKASAATLVNMALIPNVIAGTKITDQSEGNVLVSWSPNYDFDLSHYKLTVTDEFSNFNITYTPVDTFQLVAGLNLNEYYYFTISAVDFDGYEGLQSMHEFIPLSFTHDGGILIVDETIDGDGSLLKPSDEQVDSFYSNLCKKYTVTEIDALNDGIRISDITKYSTIIWHGKGNMEHLQNLSQGLQRYLDAGGNFIYAGEKPSYAIESNTVYPNTFSPGDFIYDYLKIQSTYKVFATRFNGGISTISGYPDIYTDSSKTSEQSNYHLRNIESIFPTEEAQTLYLYSSGYDTSTVQAGMVGQPVGVIYDGVYKSVVLSFPLYYMENPEAQLLMERILTDEFGEITNIAKPQDLQPVEFSLAQNYPNPFNATTTISYQLPVSSDIKLSIYNMLGQKMITLMDENQTAGKYDVVWDASDVSSGVYFYRLEAGDYRKTKKLLLLK